MTRQPLPSYLIEAMRDPLTVPAEAYVPDADRAGPDASAQLPEWLVHFLAMLILFLLEHAHAARLRRSFRMAALWPDRRPDLPAGSTQSEAASIRGAFGNAIAWMCRRRGIGPGHKDWPELSHAVVAFGGSLKGFRAGARLVGCNGGRTHTSCRAWSPASACLRRPQRCYSARLWRMPRRRRRMPCNPKPRMPDCLRHGCPQHGGRFSPVPAPVRRPGRQAAPTANSCHV